MISDCISFLKLNTEKNEKNEKNQKREKKEKVMSKSNGKAKSAPLQQPFPQKSIWKAYFLWLFGGIFGAHHLYLNNDIQAFLWWASLGGYFGIGWLADFFTIPEMVRDTNEDPVFIEQFKEKLKRYPKPQFSISRFTCAYVVSYAFSQLVMIAIPEEDLGGINWSFMHWLIPFAVAIGIWAAGNMGREKGTIWHCLAAAYIAYPLRYFVYNEAIWLTVVIVASAFAFDYFSKRWLLEPPKRRNWKQRSVRLIPAAILYLSLWGSFLLFNGKITDSEGDSVPVYEAIHHFFTSPWWTDLKQTLEDTWQFGQHNGWYETWKLIVDTMDVDGEQNAYKVLGLLPVASQSEITSAFRKLSRENHPDKFKGDQEKLDAQNRFMEITKAYEILSKIKSKRRQKNKQFSEEL